MPKSVDITAMEFAKSAGSEQESSERDSDNSGVLEPHQVVQKILAEEDNSVFEKRVQAIAFLAEVVWMVEDYGPEEANFSLTGAEFRRAARGVFSRQIREAIGEVNHVYSRVAYIQGNKTRKYDPSKVTDPAGEENSSGDAESIAYGIIEDTVEFANQFSDDNLMKACLTLDDIEGMKTGEPIDWDHVIDTI